MGLTGVPLQIQKQMDNLASYRETIIDATAGRTSLWLMAYNGADQTYVDAVVGTTLAGVDTTLNNCEYGRDIANWFALHQNYLILIGQTVTTGQAGQIDAWLAAQKWRVSQYFNRVYKEWNGSYLTLTNVFPRDDLALGTHAQSGNVFTPGSSVDLTQSGLGRIMAQIPVGTTIGAATYTVTATLTRFTGAGLSLAVAFPNGSIAGTKLTYGEQALSGNAASGQNVIAVAATAQFIAGEYILIYDSTGSSEWGVIQSVTLNTSITLTGNLVNSYATVNSAKVSPLFSGVTAATTANGTAGDNCAFKINPDRTIALNGPA